MTRLRNPVAKKLVGKRSTSGRSNAKTSRLRKPVIKKLTQVKMEAEDDKSIFEFAEKDDIKDAPIKSGAYKEPSSAAKDLNVTSNAPETKESPTKISTLPTIVKPKPRHAVGVDTRCADNIEYINTTVSVLNECSSFIYSLGRQGLAPAILASTELKEPISAKKTSRSKQCVLGIRARRLTNDIFPQCKTGESDEMLSLQPARLVAKSVQRNNQDASVIQNELQARSSWKLFGDFVEAIIHEDSEIGLSNEHVLDIVIFTNDLTLFSDTNEVSHKREFGNFWERVKPHFQPSKVRKLSIVVVSTGRRVQRIDTEFKHEGNLAATNSMEDGKNSLAALEGVTLDFDVYVRLIQEECRQRGEDDFINNRSKVQFGSKDIPPVDIKMSTIDNTSVGFNSIYREILREYSPGWYPIQFDLPETLDGTQFSVSFDVTYKTMPFSHNSSMAQGLTRDLELLERSTLEVVQLVPIGLVDASLLYGIVLTARSHLENDIDQSREMDLIVRSLLVRLSKKDSALLLRSKGPADGSGGLFHFSGQYFLLMAEELPASIKGETTPSRATLHRYTSADHILTEASSERATTDNDHDTICELSNLVDASLELCERKAVNPLLVASTTTLPMVGNIDENLSSTVTTMDIKNGPSDITAIEEHGIWKDDTGVGSRTPPASQDSSETSTVAKDNEMVKNKRSHSPEYGPVDMAQEAARGLKEGIVGSTHHGAKAESDGSKCDSFGSPMATPQADYDSDSSSEDSACMD